MKIITNIDDFFAAEVKAREEADSHVQPFQADLRPGDFFVRFPDYDLVIWGEILEPHPEDAPLYAEAHMANYRSTRSFSLACPQGEIGDIHVATVTTTIGRAQFEAARAAGWPSDIETLSRILCPAVDRN
jgi:hypothetical protein